jgi:hypothetical protein
VPRLGMMEQQDPLAGDSEQNSLIISWHWIGKMVSVVGWYGRRR